jgi:hypothetical protein
VNDGGRKESAIRSFWGQSSWAGGGNVGKIHQFIKLYYFSADLQNEIKSFDAAIDHPIAEVSPGGFRLNRKNRAAGPGEWVHHGCVLFYLGDSGDHRNVPIPTGTKNWEVEQQFGGRRYYDVFCAFAKATTQNKNTPSKTDPKKTPILKNCSRQFIVNHS